MKKAWKDGKLEQEMNQKGILKNPNGGDEATLAMTVGFHGKFQCFHCVTLLL